jgi:hypothetical protein
MIISFNIGAVDGIKLSNIAHSINTVPLQSEACLGQRRDATHFGIATASGTP